MAELLQIQHCFHQMISKSKNLKLELIYGGYLGEARRELGEKKVHRPDAAAAAASLPLV